MSRERNPCRLTMLLPERFALLVPEGRHAPCLMGCLVEILPGRLMTITGPTRDKVFEQADRFLRVLVRRNPPPPMSIAATLTSPCGVRDGWQCIINAEIAFVPSQVEATIPAPALRVVG
jgi:hypothetical protein